ncbi:S8 family peptidase [Streptomyces gobiensis]|uniref:S8 family peptidase n=1 Tax=Streptomyces gobiensis TaxID=2875706 RepID=UPI001E2F8C0F|nr:S8 family peptidase [Streptomyces gobiensis]UGY92623.1 S8 family peptidase [Streptomyces gobiensis]
MRMLSRTAAAALLLLGPLVLPPAAAAHPDHDPTPTTAPTAPADRAPAPLHRSADALPGRYIVTLEPKTDVAAAASQLGVKPLFQYKTALRGFAASLSPDQLAAVRKFPGVAAVEEDSAVSVPETAARRPTGRAARGARVPAASWGLDRIDQRNLPLDGQFNVNRSGLGASIYITDTGIDYFHSEFGGRAVFGFDAIGDGRRGRDCHGHGTHVAGTAGGATYGVARQATLVSVRVLDCAGEGTLSGVIAAFDWVADNARQPAVLNASFGDDRSPATNRAVNTLATRGVLPVAAAGNDAKDACQVSPASADRAFTVGATDQQDRQTSFSNFGECLSLYAPGAQIVSARLGGGSRTLDGTSMAAPHVAGVAALYKTANPNADAATVTTWLNNTSTKGVLTVDETSLNRLLFTGGL